MVAILKKGSWEKHFVRVCKNLSQYPIIIYLFLIGIKKCDCENLQRDNTNIYSNNIQRDTNSLSGSLRTMERLEIDNLKGAAYLGDSFDFDNSER